MKVQDVLGLVGAAVVFLLLLLCFNWNPVVAAGLSIAVYLGLSLLLKPTRKIGGKNAEDLVNGDSLLRQLDEARDDLKTIEDTGRRIDNPKIQKGAKSLSNTGFQILKYLGEHTEKIPEARRFLNYYLDTAAKILTNYQSFVKHEPPKDTLKKETADVNEALTTLSNVFENQYRRLLQGEMMDMAAEVGVLKTMASQDGTREEVESKKETEGGDKA